MKMTLRFTLICSALCVLFACSPDNSNNFIWGPEHQKYITLCDVNKLVVLKIFTENGILLYQDDTRASVYQEFSVQWLNSNKFIFYSSDIGDTIYFFHDNSWHKHSANIFMQPSGKYFLQLMAASETKGYIYIQICKENNFSEFKEVFSTMMDETFPADAPYYESSKSMEIVATIGEIFPIDVPYYESIEWPDDDNFVLKTTEGMKVFSLEESLKKWNAVGVPINNHTASSSCDNVE